MTIDLILAFNLALLAALVSPGPALLLSLRTALVKGRGAGIQVGIGLAFAAACWTAAALMGLDGLFAAFPWAYTGMKIIGALYLFHIAWQAWRDARQRVEDDQPVANHNVFDGILLNLSNPKSVLFAAAVLVVIFPPDLSLFEMSFIIANHFVIEVCFYSLFAIALSTQTMSNRYLAVKTWFDRAAAVVMAGLGLRLLLQR